MEQYKTTMEFANVKALCKPRAKYIEEINQLQLQKCTFLQQENAASIVSSRIDFELRDAGNEREKK